MSATVRVRGVAPMGAFIGAMTLGMLAIPIDSAQARLQLVDFGVTALPPSLASSRASTPYTSAVLAWPGAARLPVVMP
jgi:hypothetical protein